MMSPVGYFLWTLWPIVFFSGGLLSSGQEDGYKWSENSKGITLQLKSEYCQARCLAKCKDAGFLLDCPQKCEIFSGNKWIQECEESEECVDTCNHLTNTTGDVPSAPVSTKVLPISSHQVRISWTSAETSETNNSLIYVIEYKTRTKSSWTVLAKTWQSQYDARNLDVCTVYYYKIAAVNKYGQSNYSTVFTRSAEMFPVPGPMQNPSFLRKPYFDEKDQYFKAVFSWDPPKGWNGSTDISQYSRPTSSKICNSTNHDSVIGIPVPIVTYETGNKNILHVKVLSKALGCRFEFRLHAVSRCGINGKETPLKMDVSDCKLIDKYHPCPTQKLSIEPDRVRDVVVSPVNNTMNVKISWKRPAHLGSSRYLVEYRLQWGPLLQKSFIPTIKSVENQTSVPANKTKTVITVTQTDVGYGFRILAVGSDSKTVKWGLLTTHTFTVPKPVPVLKKTTSGSPRLKTTNPSVSATQARFIVTLNTTESMGAPYIADEGVMMGRDPGENGMHKGPRASRDDESRQQNNVALYISIPAVVLLLMIIGAIYGIRRQRKFFHLEQQGSAFAESYNLYNQIRAREESPPATPSREVPCPDKWEIPYGYLYLYDELGEGAFGHVYMATLRFCDLQNDQMNFSTFAKELAGESSEITVAVKKLHEYADKCQKQEFLREIHLMKTLGSHPNVVNMIGCCTVEEPLCLVVENMPNGDLLHYLRKHRGRMQGEGVEDDHIYYEEERLTYQDLLSFARQIAKGMEFLSQKGFVHRDLASRNILVGENRLVKVSDFGLTRYVYDDKVYVNRKGGKLPLKWMSIEAIFDLTFSTASDVWAFGVVLFEIITLGGTPYPTISNKDLLRELKMGYRMEKPDNCDDELYCMMLDCWEESPHDRPDFTDLKLRLERMIEMLSNTDYLDISLDNLKAYYNAPIMEEDESEGEDDDSDIFGAGFLTRDFESLENQWPPVRLASEEEDLSPSCSSSENLVMRRKTPSTSGASSGRESMETKDESPSEVSDSSDLKDSCPLVHCSNHDSGHVSYDIELDSGPENDQYLIQRRSFEVSKNDIQLWDDVCV